MTDEPNHRENARQDRLRDALRENLKRRKSQARGRSGKAAAGEHGDVAPGPERDDQARGE